MSLIAILGGTGKEGQGLALRFAARGRAVVLGSREMEKGARVAEELNAKLGSLLISGTANRDAAREGTVIVSTLPYPGHVETATELSEVLEGKLVVTATIRWPPGLDGALSAAEDLARVLPPSTRVAAAFQTVSAHSLKDLEGEGEDVLVFADAAETRREAIALVEATGLRGVEGGALEKTRIAEALTGLLLGINKRYGVKSTGIRITRLPGLEP
jgi:8-hydroxy-5-deazaflavin:NADPH oxidoreductase